MISKTHTNTKHDIPHSANARVLLVHHQLHVPQPLRDPDGSQDAREARADDDDSDRPHVLDGGVLDGEGIGGGLVAAVSSRHVPHGVWRRLCSVSLRLLLFFFS